MKVRPIALALAATTLALTGACLPYSVGSTAQTVRPGDKATTNSYWIMPNGIALNEKDSTKASTALFGFDRETRWGIDSASDFGLRVPSASGLVASYKQRVSGYAHPDSAAVSWQLGGGVVNFAQHMELEASLLTSSAKRGNIAWYGGARIVHTIPMSSGLKQDQPSIGALIGARIGLANDDIMPEIAIYHDPSVTRIRSSNFIIVPSLSIKGTALNRVARYVFGGRFGRLPPP